MQYHRVRRALHSAGVGDGERLPALLRFGGVRSSLALQSGHSYVDFSAEHHIGRQSISKSLKLLDHLGLIEIAPGPRLVNVFRFSNRWRTIDEAEAERLAALAREVLPHRRFEKRREPKVPKPVNPTEANDSPATARHAAVGAEFADDAVAG